MRAVIFANGDLRRPAVIRRSLRPNDWIIAADGGARLCRRLGLSPELLIGDFDSLNDAARWRLEAAGTSTARYPEAKDQTDLELALLHAVAHGAEDILVVGALGDRWDHSLASFALALAPGLASATLTFDDGTTWVGFLRAGDTLRLPGQPGDLVSLIPLGGDAEGITTQGLRFPLNREALPFGSTRGVSNVIEAAQAVVSLRSGRLVAVLTRSSPFTRVHGREPSAKPPRPRLSPPTRSRSPRRSRR